MTVSIGSEVYTTAGSTLFYAGRYYTQIVSTQDDPKFGAFALELAKRVAASQSPGGATRPRAATGTGIPDTAAAVKGSTSDASGEVASAEKPAVAEGDTKAITAPPKPAQPEFTPADYFALLPAAGRQGDAK